MGKGKQADKAAKRVALGVDLFYLAEKLSAGAMVYESHRVNYARLQDELQGLHNVMEEHCKRNQCIWETLRSGDMKAIRKLARDWRAKDNAGLPQTEDDIPF